jgi:hypothetical protein
VKIRDVVTNLETKLNTAIVSEINNIQERGEPTALETDRYTTRFILDLDTGKYNAWVDDTELPEGNIKFPDSALERDFYYYRIGVALSRADDGVFFD